MLVTSNFSFFHSVFYPFEELSAIFIKNEIVNIHCFYQICYKDLRSWVYFIKSFMLLHNSLTHFYTMTPFDMSGKDAFSKNCGKRRKCWLPAFSPFPTMFCTRSKTEIIIYVALFCHLQMLSRSNFYRREWVK